MTQPPIPGPPSNTGRNLAAVPRPPMWPAAGANPGDPTASIDYAVARLAELDSLDVAEHPARFEAVHATLTDALSAIDGF
jgi:hypothetical protein